MIVRTAIPRAYQWPTAPSAPIHTEHDECGDPTAVDPGLVAASQPKYFRTYEQVKAAMQGLAAKYPDLVEVIDIGDTSEKVAGKADRDVLLLRLTAKGVRDGQKPSSLHLGGEHAREIANPELLMRHATRLLEAYGRDADITALLQTRVIDIVPMMNADGHAVVERGYAGEPGGNVMQRKNTSSPKGTDLNRNYDFRWGGVGASSNPASDTYRGPSAASEPEVRAIQDHVTRTKPGIFIDWHSHGQLNLYPWGDTRDKVPDFAGFDALAKKFTSYNGHRSQQSIQLYPTTGTSKDWVYGVHRIPGFTIETGTTFHQSDVQFEDTWKKNEAVMLYADKVADAPFQRAFGPDVAHVSTRQLGRGLELSVAVSDAANGGQAIQAVEAVLDPLTTPGAGIRLQAADGAFDSVAEEATGLVAFGDDASAGQRLVHVRAQDAEGNWGPLTAQWIGKADR